MRAVGLSRSWSVSAQDWLLVQSWSLPLTRLGHVPTGLCRVEGPRSTHHANKSEQKSKSFVLRSNAKWHVSEEGMRPFLSVININGRTGRKRKGMEWKRNEGNGKGRKGKENAQHQRVLFRDKTKQNKTGRRKRVG